VSLSSTCHTSTINSVNLGSRYCSTHPFPIPEDGDSDKNKKRNSKTKTHTNPDLEAVIGSIRNCRLGATEEQLLSAAEFEERI
jgi:hypothetical protein